MSYSLSSRSRTRLLGVHADLVRVIERAIEVTLVDFTVLEGVRGMDRQQALLAAGATRTLRSRHLTGHAVDIGAWVGGEVRWDWPLYFDLAEAVGIASREVDVPVVWGGSWKVLSRHEDVTAQYWEYVQAKRERNETPFCDGPHFQLPRDTYLGEYYVGKDHYLEYV